MQTSKIPTREYAAPSILVVERLNDMPSFDGIHLSWEKSAGGLGLEYL